MLGTVSKQPADQLDYPIDYSRWIPDEDEILTVTHAIEPAAEDDDEDHLRVDAVRVDPENPALTVWVSRGQKSKTYKVSVTVATRGGRIKEADFKVRIRDC